MIEKISNILNEMSSPTALMDKIAIVVGDNSSLKRNIVIIDRNTLKIIPNAEGEKIARQMMVFDNKLNFSSAFKNYVRTNFTELDTFFKNSMWVNSFSDAKLRLKKENKYLDFGNNNDYESESMYENLYQEYRFLMNS